MPSLKKFWYASLAFAVGVNGQASPAAATTGTTFSQTYDFIVVGSGAGGSMVANRLVRMGQTVLVLEAGPTDFSQSTNFDLQNWFLLSQEEPNAYRWNDTTQPEPGLGGRTIAMSTMRSLGGGTTFNAGTWVRGSVFDWNAIATAAQDSSWNYNNIMPLFNEIECWLDPSQGPCEGEFAISKNPPVTLYNQYVTAAAQAGLGPLVPNYNNNPSNRDGPSFMQVASDSELRESGATAELRPLYWNLNLNVCLGCSATKILFNKKKQAIGVQYVQNGQTIQVGASKEVIVSGGVTNTPKLLMLSGIGDAAHLTSFGIPVVYNNPQVGMNLMDHTFLLQCYDAANVLPSTNIYSAVHIFCSADGTRNVHDPDYQIFMAGNQECLAGFPVCSNRTICFWGAYLRPQNRGHVRLTANNFTAPLNISIGYLTVPGDMTKMVNMSQIMTNITQTPIFKSTFNVTDNFTPKALGLNVTDFITQTASTLIHYTGTSSIGQVVDTHLLVKGVTKLRVVDASAIPVLISGNTQAATYMVGLKAAMAIRATYNLPSW